MKYQRYAAYKDSGVEWLGDVPEHWEVKQLKRSVEGCVNGFWGGEPNEDENNTIVIRVADFERSKLSLKDDGYTYRRIEDKEKVRRQLKFGDLLLEKSGGGEKTLVGQVVLFDKEFEAITSNFVAKMTPNFGFDSRFLNYVFSRLYGERINYCSIKQNTGIQNLDSESYLAEKVGFPNLIEQQKIANFLDHETAKIDTLIEKQRRLIELLKEKRQAVISHAVTKGLNPNAPMKESGVEWLGEVLEYWTVSKIGHCAFVTKLTGFEYTNLWETSEDGEIIALRGFNVQERYLELHQTERISFDLSKRLARSKLSNGDIVFPCTGTIGNAALIESDNKFHINQNVAKISFENVNPKFAIYWLTSSFVRKLIERNNMSGMQPVVLIGDIRKLPIPRMSFEEQNLITDYLDTELNKFNKIIDHAQQAVNLIQERRTALISAAVTGKIDVRNWR